MKYDEALKELNKHVGNMPKHVSLFISPEGSEKDLFSRAEQDDNRKALEETGTINNDNLEVFATYEEGTRIYYPTLSYFFAMHPELCRQ